MAIFHNNPISMQRSDRQRYEVPSIDAALKVGDAVRIRSNPGRHGLVMDERIRSGRRYLGVKFPDRTDWRLAETLEVIPRDRQREAPLTLLRKGKFGRSRDLRANLTHIRLTGQLVDLIYSLDVTNTDFLPHQFKPVIQFIESPTGALLIADQLGLGKTVEAGLIWTELRSRLNARRLLVICPAMRVEKWRLELARRFGVRADVCKAGDLLVRFKEVLAGEIAEFALIVSLQSVRPGDGWDDARNPAEGIASELARYLDDNACESLVDLLVIDEAHRLCRPARPSAVAGRLFKAVSERLLLLSATPINAGSENLCQLLGLVDGESAIRSEDFAEMLEANKPLVAAREQALSATGEPEAVRALLERAHGHRLLRRNRQLEHLLRTPLTPEQFRDPASQVALAQKISRANLLGYLVSRTRRSEVVRSQVHRQPHSESIVMTAMEKVFVHKVTRLIQRYAGEKQITHRLLLASPGRQVASSMAAALMHWRFSGAALDDRQIYEDLGMADPPGADADSLTRRLVAFARGEGRRFDALAEEDSKYRRLEKILGAMFRAYPGKKVVIFAYFRATLGYLRGRLRESGLDPALLAGGMEERCAILDRFWRDDTSGVLLTSEIASEGMDLHHACFMINYDLPWNPMKVEQRIGRLDRLGQRAERVGIWTLLHRGAIDSLIYDQLLQPLGVLDSALGDPEVILGEEIEKLAMDLVFYGLDESTPQVRIDRAQAAIAKRRNRGQEQEDQAVSLALYQDHIPDELSKSRELGRTISSLDLWTYVKDFCDTYYTGCEFRQLGDSLTFDIRLSSDMVHELNGFIAERGLWGRTRLNAVAGSRIRCRFENKTADLSREVEDTLEQINQFHPLIAFVSHRVRQANQGRYYPLVALQLPVKDSGLPSGNYAFLIRRWHLTGVRTIEKLCFCMAYLKTGGIIAGERAERLIALAIRSGDDWLLAHRELDHRYCEDLLKRCMAHGDRQFEEYKLQVDVENRDRADFQSDSFRRHLERRGTVLEKQAATHRAHKQPSLAVIAERRLRAETERVERRIAAIEESRQLQSDSFDVCLGVIQVRAEGE